MAEVTRPCDKDHRAFLNESLKLRVSVSSGCDAPHDEPVSLQKRKVHGERVPLRPRRYCSEEHRLFAFNFERNPVGKRGTGPM